MASSFAEFSEKVKAGYKPVPEADLSSLFAIKSLKSIALFCVITSADEKILLNQKADERSVFRTPKTMLRNTENVEDAIFNDFPLASALGKSAIELSEIADVDFLGMYRLAKPKKRQLKLPYAVDLQPTSDKLPISYSDTLSWFSFDEIESWLDKPYFVDDAPRTSTDEDFLDGVAALKLYFETLQEE